MCTYTATLTEVLKPGFHVSMRHPKKRWLLVVPQLCADVAPFPYHNKKHTGVISVSFSLNYLELPKVKQKSGFHLPLCF